MLVPCYLAVNLPDAADAADAAEFNPASKNHSDSKLCRIDEWIDMAVPGYDKYLSDEEIKGLIAFYQKQHSGKRLWKCSPSSAWNCKSQGAKWGQELGRLCILEFHEANARYQRETATAQPTPPGYYGGCAGLRTPIGNVAAHSHCGPGPDGCFIDTLNPFAPGPW
jgi:hypothetical protein